MAVVYDKGVIMGADSRTTMGSYIVSLAHVYRRSLFPGADPFSLTAMRVYPGQSSDGQADAYYR